MFLRLRCDPYELSQAPARNLRSRPFISVRWRKAERPEIRRFRRMPARLRAGGYPLTAAAREPGRRLSLRLRAASGDPRAPARVALRALAVSLRQVRGSRDADGGGGERRSPGTTPITLPAVTSRTTTSPNLVPPPPIPPTPRWQRPPAFPAGPAVASAGSSFWD